MSSIIKRAQKGWRWWWHYDKPLTIRNELYLFVRGCALKLNLHADSESTISFHIAIPYLISWFFTVDARFGYSEWYRKLLCLDDDHKYGGRQFGFSYYNGDGCMSGGSINLYCGAYINEWNSKDPKWYNISIYPQEILFGSYSANTKDLDTTDHIVTIEADRNYPEKTYTLQCKEFQTTWTWPRLRKPFVLNRYEVSCEGGVPHPGKGTADYNCNESSLNSQTCISGSRKEAVDKFVEQVYWYRKNYPM